jgi:hypothetical protein
MQQQPIDYFSTATDYVRGASSFFLNVFDLGATTYERVRDRVETLKNPDSAKQTQATNFFTNLNFEACSPLL